MSRSLSRRRRLRSRSGRRRQSSRRSSYSNSTFDLEVGSEHEVGYDDGKYDNNMLHGDNMYLPSRDSIDCDMGGVYASQPVDVELSIRLSQ